MFKNVLFYFSCITVILNTIFIIYLSKHPLYIKILFIPVYYLVLFFLNIKSHKNKVNRSGNSESVNYSSSEIKSMIDSIDYSNHPKDSIGYRYNKRKNK